MVMVGEIVGEGMAQERTVIGEAPNMAARLQGLAGRNGIVVGSLMRELTGDTFAFDDLGSHELKGISGLVQTWGVTGLSDENGSASLGFALVWWTPKLKCRERREVLDRKFTGASVGGSACA